MIPLSLTRGLVRQKNRRPTWDSNPEPSAMLLSNGMTIPKADALSIEPAGLDEKKAKNSVVHSVGTIFGVGMLEYILQKIEEYVKKKNRSEMRTRFTASQRRVCVGCVGICD